MKDEDLNKVLHALRLANECTYADEITEGAKNYLRKELENAIETIERKLLFNHLREDI